MLKEHQHSPSNPAERIVVNWKRKLVVVAGGQPVQQKAGEAPDEALDYALRCYTLPSLEEIGKEAQVGLDVTEMTLSPSGDLLFVGTRDHALLLYPITDEGLGPELRLVGKDATARSNPPSRAPAHNSPIRRFAFSGRRLLLSASGYGDEALFRGKGKGELRFWDPSTREELHGFLSPLPDPPGRDLSAVAISPSGRHVAVGYWNGEVRIHPLPLE